MIKLNRTADCCGCNACVQTCPKNCISMATDAEGFWYPSVDTSACIQCGACDRVCPIHKPFAKKAPENVYVSFAQDEAIRENSSSGGIFTLLAETILSQGGVVFGAAFAENLFVEHVMVDNSDDLNRLRGSKYLQSRIGNTYRQAKKVLEEERPVLFSGVGCQIAGLKRFLGKEYENLYTVDVLCHGVPSSKIWEKYIQEIAAAAKTTLSKVNFRKKESGWKTYSVEMTFQNGNRIYECFFRNTYMQLFLSEICLRPSCHTCQFREGKSGADLTIGDAWGVQNWMPEMDDDRGTSIVLVNSDKGHRLWDAVLPRTRRAQLDAETALSSNSVWKNSVKPHPRRKQFFRAAAEGASMKELEKICRRTILQRAMSFGKRVVKKILKMMRILK